MTKTKKPDPFIYDPLTLPDALKFTAVCLRRYARTAYRMEDRLVFTYRWETPSSEEYNFEGESMLFRDDGALILGTMDETKLYEFIVEHVPFGHVNTRTGSVTPAAPPKALATHFMKSPDRWLFPVLTGVVEAPTLRADGSLLDTEGYDKTSGLFLDLNGVEYPSIPDKPTKADAMKALAILREPFEEFPFAEDNFECPSLSVALSAVLTGIIRRTLNAAPLHGFDAPEAGSGKGLCCNIVTLIVTGRRATAITFGDDENDFKKFLFSALLANDQVIVLDNLTRPLEGPSLNSALTERTLTDRILGFSRTATVPTNALFMANGNNLAIRGDMHRRIIAARIEPGENPEERTFKRKNLLAWVEDNRPRFVAAALTILRAYEAAGRPPVTISEYGSFEEWSARVRAPLVWLGMADPCLTRAQFKEADPQRDALATVFRSLHEAYGREWFKAKDIVQASRPSETLGDALNDAGVPMESKLLGTYLINAKGRTLDGLTLQTMRDNKAKVNVFRVVEAP
jgi:hypothetical protein